MSALELNDEAEQGLVSGIFGNAVECLSEDDRRLPQIQARLRPVPCTLLCGRLLLCLQLCGRRPFANIQRMYSSNALHSRMYSRIRFVYSISFLGRRCGARMHVECIRE